MTLLCPLCGDRLATGPSYGEGVRRFTPGICDSAACRVSSVVVEWITGHPDTDRHPAVAPGADQLSIRDAQSR